MTKEPTTTAAAVSTIGRGADCAGHDEGVDQISLFAPLHLHKIDQQDGVSDDDARKRNEADHRGCGEKCAEKPVAGKNPHQGQRDRGHDDERRDEAPEPGDDQDINQDQDGGKG